jgi:hypothetical protein
LITPTDDSCFEDHPYLRPILRAIILNHFEVDDVDALAKSLGSLHFEAIPPHDDILGSDRKLCHVGEAKFNRDQLSELQKF